MKRASPVATLGVARSLAVAALATSACGVSTAPLSDPAAGALPSLRELPAADAPEPAPELPAPQPVPVEVAEPVALVAPNGAVIAPCAEPPPGMACVAGGPFLRGADDGPADARPRQQVWTQTFYMDLYEVTYADYKRCARVGLAGTDDAPQDKAMRCPRGGPLYHDFSRDRQPITGVTWFGAVRYCELAGKHLPSEAEWEKAARGPDGARYPWGDDDATCDHAVIEDHRGRSCGVKKLREHPDKGRTFEVGSRPAGVYGLYDLAGNAWEWVYDWHSPDWARCGDACAGVDPRGPCAGTSPCRGHDERVVKGGSWYWSGQYAQAFWRRPHVPHNDPFHHFGFRCAASLGEAKALTESVPPSSPPA